VEAEVAKDSRFPTGTVTLFFTDIVASTQHWEERRDAMGAALRRHDQLLRAAIEANGGHVFKTVGDAFCATFSRASDALAAALTAQRAIEAEDWSAVDGLRVRMALHSGAAEEREGDYFGPPVNRVARLLSIAHGGQVVLSATTAELLRGVMPRETTLLDLGEHRLKDLMEPEQVWQLLGAGLVKEFPPLRSLQSMPNNLPQQLTPLIGREAEVAKVTEMLGEHRLVTIVGSGGAGKTRVSLQVGANLLAGSGDGVWFIELAPLSSAEYVPAAVAQAMEIRLPEQGDPLDLLVRAIKHVRALLVFDNCEHIIEGASRVIGALLRGCPQVAVLTSSRQALQIGGEATYRLPALAVPPPAELPLTAARAASWPALALFVERAAGLDDRFALTDENAPVVADICRQLDGIPLAIELAAARVKILSPKQLRARLDERFRVLTGGRRDVLPRQQTLIATIDWSHDLLDESERALFRRLGIFANGFTLEGAVAVGAPLEDFEILDLLASLVDKSLVVAEPDGETVRYRFLESTRAYAREKLAAQGELDATSRRHAEHFRDVFEEVTQQLAQTGNGMRQREELAAELEDVRAALDWASGSDPEIGAELLATVGNAWESLNLAREGLEQLERFIALVPEAQPRLLACMWLALQAAAKSAWPAKAFPAACEAVAQARRSGDATTLARTLVAYAAVAAPMQKFAEAQAASAEAQLLAPPEDVGLRVSLLAMIVLVRWLQGDLDGAAEGSEELQSLYRITGNSDGVRYNSAMLGEIEHARGNTVHAVSLAREAVAGFRAFRERFNLTLSLANLCAYLLALDRLAEAREAGFEALREGRAYDREAYATDCALEHLSLLLVLEGDNVRGAQLAGYADAALSRIGFERWFTEKTSRARLDSVLRERLAAGEIERLTAIGGELRAEEAIALAESPLSL
jgi:predicted ATPase/class 3 adenylate cyclase